MIGDYRAMLVALATALLLQPTQPQAVSGRQATAPPSNPEATRANPLLAESTLAYQAPPFDTIRDADYEPAMIEGMSEQRAEVQRIIDNPEPPTFQNTVVALERSGALLNRVSRIFNALVAANTNPTLQRTDVSLSPTLAAHRDAMLLNAALFARIKRVYEARATLSLTSEDRRLVEHTYRDYVRAGAALNESDKTRLRALNQEQSALTTSFRNHVLASANASSPAFDRAAALDGLSAEDMAAAASAAAARGLKGQWVLPLQNTTQQPAMTYLKDRAVRERIFKASSARNNGGEHDTTPVITRLAQLRAERATLLGYETHAAFTLDNQMAKTPGRALQLMTDMVPAVTARATAEAARIQQVIDAEHGGFTLQPWDWQYYAEQVRSADYAFDESQVRPYFELERVLRDGVFFAATKLYGITFKERRDLPVYHPDVRVFEVFDRDGSGLGLFYADYFARPAKRGGGWTNSLVSQSRLLPTKTVTTNTCNFPKPAPGAPALLSASEVTTMFHEFGHALNSLFSTVPYPGLGGLPRDFGEVPSQFNEHWALEPPVFANYAKHYKTGERMPKALEEKIRKASTFNQGFATAEVLAAALLDVGWHTLPPAGLVPDVAAFEAQTLERFHIALPAIPPRYGSRYFAHIWANGYSAGYYSYLWSAVIDTDAYHWFREHGGMTRENGQRFRDMVLSKGDTVDADAMYRAFRGRDADVEPLLIERGLRPAR